MPHKIEKAEGVYTAGALPRILGDNLRRAREEMGLSQTRFGLMVGLSRQMINTLECRGCNIQIDSLQRIADGLDIPAWEALGRPYGRMHRARKLPLRTYASRRTRLLVGIGGSCACVNGIHPARAHTVSMLKRMTV